MTGAVTLTFTVQQLSNENKSNTRVHNVRMFIIPSIKLVRPIGFQQVFYYAKFVQKSREELKAELESKRFNLVRNAITSVLKRRKYLSVTEWKSLGTELQAENHLRTVPNLNRVVFAALLSLRPPNDSLQNARHFIEATNIDQDLNVKRTFIELYAKKESEDKLTAEEEKDLIQMLVSNISKTYKFGKLNFKSLFYLSDVMSL